MSVEVWYDGRVFVTADEKNKAAALQWAEHAARLALAGSSSPCGDAFGRVGDNGFTTATVQQLATALGAVGGAMGEAYRAKKNVFSIAALNTNHVFAVVAK